MNEIGNTLFSVEEGKAKYDETMKIFLSNKQFLSRIMKRFVPEFAEFSLDDIEHHYIEAESVTVSKVGVERNRNEYDLLNVIILRINDKAREMSLEMLKDKVPYEVVAKYAKVSVEILKQWEWEEQN